MKRLTVLLLAAATMLALMSMPAQAQSRPGVRRLGHTLTMHEFKAFRCGHYRTHHPVGAYLVHRTAWRIVPRAQLRHRNGVKAQCAFTRPHPVPIMPARRPVPPPSVPTPPAPPAPAPVGPRSTCRDEIGDPTVTPHTSGLRPVHDLDAFQPSGFFPDDDPQDEWNNPTYAMTVDDAGHVRLTYGGVAYIHPAGDAQYGIATLREYTQTGDHVWLDRAETAANELLSVSTPAGQIPHDYPWQGPEGLLKPGGYSAITQGNALSLAVRLYRATGDQTWRDWADRLFATLATPGTAAPSISFVDTDGYLWFEEFPLECPARVWNGHVFATFAIADYYQMTGSQQALDVFDAAATTALHYMPNIRRPGQTANYNVSHQHAVTPAYHHMMTAQLRYLATITEQQEFTDWADLLVSDF